MPERLTLSWFVSKCSGLETIRDNVSLSVFNFMICEIYYCPQYIALQSIIT